MSTSTKQQALTAITAQGLLPLFFHEDAGLSLRVMQALYAAGIRVVEYTNRGKSALNNFRYIKSVAGAELPDMQIGIGTIKNAAEAEAFMLAGADFIICPVADAATGKLVQDAGLLWIPGCFTPTEINIAYQQHAPLVKIFPAFVGGPEYIKAVKELFPGLLFIPTGGVEATQENINAWFNAGVCAVGIGSKLISKTSIDNQQFDELQTQTKHLLRLIRSIKN